MAVKNKISSVKRSNQKKNKPVKKGVPKNKKRKNVEKAPEKLPPKPQNQYSDSEESDHGEDMLGMVDEDDLSFLKQAITNKSYSLLNKVRYNKSSEKSQDVRKRKRKLEEDEGMEEEYENQETEDVKLKNLLPIKTKSGIVSRSIEVEEKSDDEPEKQTDDQSEGGDEETEETFELQDDEFDPSKPVTTADLLASREKALRLKKIHIGTLSSGLLENPEEKITNFKTLLTIMTEETAEAFLTVRKLATISLLEVFKDVLPSYQIKIQNTGDVKLKKDTLQLQKYETQLLQYYKNYLVKLEKFSTVIVRKRGDTRTRTKDECVLAELAIHCMCELLITHSYFNYSENIASALLPFLNHRHRPIREMVNACCKTIFKQDKKGDITLKIMRLINSYLKTHAHNVNTEMLEVLLALRIKEVNLDEEKEHEIKQKKLQAKKGNILKLSKKEKKRKKRLQELEKEMLETKAEENKQVKEKNMTEITKILFGIYFRILKSSTNTKVLGICLEGLAKFSHCINLDFYSDLVNVLINILKQDWLGYREKLHCIQTVLIMLSGQGEVLTLDPSRFYQTLYETLLTTTAGKNHNDFDIVINTLTEGLIRRRKKLTQQRLIGFTKRLTTLSLQLLHNGTLGGLCLVRNTMQLNKFVDVLLDLDETVGDGKYLPELGDPEYCNAASTALYELIPLMRHYHPIVCKYARNIASGVPATGDGSLPPEIGKLSAEELFVQYDPTNVEFNPSIPIPKKVAPKPTIKNHNFADNSFKYYCKETTRKKQRIEKNQLNFVV